VRLAAIPAGESPANTRSPVHVVVISSGRAGDQTAESLEVKALWGREAGSNIVMVQFFDADMAFAEI
jgi:hypothetical protein